MAFSAALGVARSVVNTFGQPWPVLSDSDGRLEQMSGSIGAMAAHRIRRILSRSGSASLQDMDNLTPIDRVSHGNHDSKVRVSLIQALGTR